VLKAGGAPADHFEFSIQPLLVHAGVHVLLFDTGAGGFFGDIAGKLPESMTAAGEKPASVTDIFISACPRRSHRRTAHVYRRACFPQCDHSHIRA